MLRATSSLPVPVSPTTSTSTSELATCSIVSNTLRIAGTAADHVVEAVGPLDLPAQQFVFGLEAPAAEQALRAVGQRHRIDRLSQVVARSGAKAGGRRVEARFGRHHDHRQLGIGLPRSAQQFQSLGADGIDPRHQQIERAGAQLGDRPRRSSAQREFGRFQTGQGLLAAPGGALVGIDDQDLRVLHDGPLTRAP